jgi:hypothetical protein
MAAESKDCASCNWSFVYYWRRNGNDWSFKP